ncbi:MAG: multifunctional CCA addition/repair protein [Gammaproteobacteria bacterium]|nr:MAG: multifunctional CCA addition/repair protein [Gammaproteobacteria bacterium]
MEIYLVGGAVRDKLLGKPGKDSDWVVVGSTPEEMEEQNFKPVGKDFPVFLHPETKEEYALARTERKSGKGYKGFTFHTSTDITLEEDLARRDLTINAIAEDHSGKLIDPFNGKQDIEDKILRHVSPAFVEDPLRVLRVARFAARFGFRIAPETMSLMKEISKSGELETLVPERVWNELEQAMGATYPSRFILALQACHALGSLFPEVERLFGVPQPEKYHPEIDTGIHTLMSLNQASRLSQDPQIRFATLVHDLGKGTTPKEKLPSHHGHEERGVKLIQALCKRYRAPKQYQELAIQVSRHHFTCHRIEEMRAETILKKLESMDAFRRPERFRKFLICCEADARGRTGFEDRAYPQADYFQQALDAANEVDTESLRQQGLEGRAMAEAIKIERINLISDSFTARK